MYVKIAELSRACLSNIFAHIMQYNKFDLSCIGCNNPEVKTRVNVTLLHRWCESDVDSEKC